MSYFQETGGLSEWEKTQLFELGYIPKRKCKEANQLQSDTSKNMYQQCDEAKDGWLAKRENRTNINCPECGYTVGYQVHQNHPTIADCGKCGHVCDVIEY
jgi:ribosomal protein S27AE|tara:strand:+ start:2583 stop:2882 length:300 start_codon:yes stop_codon:yes gene_type:complete